MKLSRPQYNHVRLDTNLTLIKDYHVIPCDMQYTAFISPPENDDPDYIVGARCRIVFYIDNVGNEVAGYLGEVQSVILNYESPEIDKDMLLYFAKDTFQFFVEYLRIKLPAIDVNFIPPPSYSRMVDSWIETLVKSGLYQN